MNRAVHFAIAYHEDGQVIGYRDGQPYGKPYKSKGPVEYKAEQAVVSFGCDTCPLETACSRKNLAVPNSTIEPSLPMKFK